MGRIAELFAGFNSAVGAGPQVVRQRRVHRFTVSPTTSTRFSIDLVDAGVRSPIVGLGFRAALQHAGAAVTLTRRAPALYIGNNLKVYANHRALGNLEIWNADVGDLYDLSSFFSRTAKPLSAPTADATNAILAWDLPMRIPTMPHLNQYHDLRNDYGSYVVELAVGALTDYAASGVTSFSSVTVDVHIYELVRGIPPADSPHYIVTWPQLRQPVESTSTMLRTTGLAGGFCPLIQYRQHDDSASGDSELVDGLVRFIRARHRGEVVLDSTPWESLRDQTTRNWSRGAGTTVATPVPSGYAIWDVDPDYDGDAMLDARSEPIFHELDTSTTPQIDTTAVTPAASDLLVMTPAMLVPNSTLKEGLARIGF